MTFCKEMKFPSATWRFRDNTRGHDGYLFVDSTSGRIVPVTYMLVGKRFRFLGYGLWFHDYSDFEIVTTHIKAGDDHKWMHEFYRIDETWMQWSNDHTDIFHELVEDYEVPEGYRIERDRVMAKSESRIRPDYTPTQRQKKQNKAEMATPRKPSDQF